MKFLQTIIKKQKRFFQPPQYSYKYIKPNQQNWVNSTKNIKAEKQLLSYYNIGLYSAIFGFCFAMVPLYRLFCEHIGIAGNLDKKDYSMKGREASKHRKFKLIFKATIDPEVDWEFAPVQEQVVVNAGETALVFYKAYNAEVDPVIGFATYNIYPEEASVYFSKIQCFCFNQQLLNPKEELQLPLYFYLEPEINDDSALFETDEIKIIYNLVKCRKQDMLKYVEEELERVEKNKKYFEELRQNKNENKN